MRTSVYRPLGLIAAFFVLLSSACEVCDDPGVIEIDPADTSFPEVFWEVTTFTSTPDGVASSIALYTGAEESINMTTAEQVTIRLVGRDEQSGIEWLDLEGGFGITCANANGAIAFSGFIPGNRVFYDLAEMECGVVEGEYPPFIIEGSTLCVPANPILTQGGYELRGSANNTVGLTSGTVLFVNVTEATGA